MHVNDQIKRLKDLGLFFNWLVNKGQLLFNPASGLNYPRMIMELPQAVLGHEDIEKILESVNTKTLTGIRDRAILETLYSTGMRCMELVNLKLNDLDSEKGVVIIRKGKGAKDRVVPIGKRALFWIVRYVNDSRFFLLKDIKPSNKGKIKSKNSDEILFLSQYGGEFNREALSHCLRKYIKRSGIKKTGSCHIFRHSMATVMLENGADIRFIQEILGHEKLDSTKIYTRVSIAKLKEVHARTHPANSQESKFR